MAVNEPPSVSGTMVHGLFAAARDVLGEEIVSRGLSAAPEPARLSVQSALPGGWTPIEHVETVFSALADATGRDIDSLHGELGRVSVERAFKTIWRLFLRVTSDEALVSRTPVIFSKSFNRGRLVARIPSPGRGEVQLVDWPDAPEWPIRGTRIGIETTLRLAGRKSVRVEGKRTPTGAVYVATWS